MAKDVEIKPVALTDAILSTLTSCGELSAESIAADLTALVAHGTLEIEGWEKLRSTPELARERTSRVKVALCALMGEKRVAFEKRNGVVYWDRVPEKPVEIEPEEKQRGLW